MAEWLEHFEIIKQLIKERLAVQGVRDTDENAAQFLGVGVATYGRWKRGQKPDLDNLVFIAKKLELSLDWLLLGKVQDRVRTGPPLSAANSSDRLTGDILHEALGLLNLNMESAAQKAGLPPEDLQDLLDSKRKPSFEEMEALYVRLGVNPAALFDNNRYWRVIPRDLLLRALAAVGYNGQTPTDEMLVEVFGINHETASEFLSNWYPEHEQAMLPPAWMAALERNYSLQPAWLLHGDTPIAKPRQLTDADSTLDAKLFRELLAEKDKRLADKDKIIDLYEKQSGGRTLLANDDLAVPTAPIIGGAKE